MNTLKNASRQARIATRGAVVAAALAALGTVGATSASAATPTASTHSGAVLVKEVRTADGVLQLFKESGVVRPDTAGGCNGNVCFTVNGSHTYVSTMYNATYYGSSGYADMQIKNPYGGVVRDTGTFWATGGNTYVLTYAPYANVSAGSWCGYSNQNGGWYTGECVSVLN